jgi:hypothetical protein
MSHDPSQANGVKAIQIDLNFTSVLSDDIITHSLSTILTRNSFFIESMRSYTVDQSVAGLLVSESFSTALFGASSIRCNAVSSFTAVSDDCAIATSISNQSVSASLASSGTASPTSVNAFRSYWRIT